MKKISSFMIILLLSFGAFKSYAQDMLQSFTEANTGFTNAYMYGHINKLVAKSMYDKKGGSSKAAYSDLTYRPNTRIKQQVVDGMIKKMKNPAPAQTFMQYDFDKAFTSITKPYGLQYNDAGDIMTAYQVINWMIANQQTQNPSATAVEAARKSTIAGLSSVKEFKHDVVVRAKMGEELKILIVILESGWMEARKKGTTKAFANQVNTSYMQKYGVNLQQTKLDDKGLHG